MRAQRCIRPYILNNAYCEIMPRANERLTRAIDSTKTLSIYDSYPRAKSRGVVVNHAGLWIHVVFNVDH